jgi:hypothetical protein
MLIHILNRLLRDPSLLLFANPIPVIRDIRVAKQATNLLERAPLGLGEEQVDEPDVHDRRTYEHEVEAPADLVERDGRADEADLAGEVEARQAERDTLRAEMVGEDLGEVNVLGCVDEEAPPEDVLAISVSMGIRRTCTLPIILTKKMKNTAARRPAVLVVPRNSAVKAQRKMTQLVTPTEPMSMKVRRPKRSMKNAVQVLPMMVKDVQQALSRRGMEPERPSEA